MISTVAYWLQYRRLLALVPPLYNQYRRFPSCSRVYSLAYIIFARVQYLKIYSRVYILYTSVYYIFILFVCVYIIRVRVLYKVRVWPLFSVVRPIFNYLYAFKLKYIRDFIIYVRMYVQITIYAANCFAPRSYLYT